MAEGFAAATKIVWVLPFPSREGRLDLMDGYSWLPMA